MSSSIDMSTALEKNKKRGRLTAPQEKHNIKELYPSDIAVTGQLSTACWQSQVSQASGLLTHALSSLSSKTFGQRSEQSPQPMQRSISTAGVAIGIPILSQIIEYVKNQAGLNTGICLFSIIYQLYQHNSNRCSLKFQAYSNRSVIGEL
jgi:hypothetical protein